MIKITEQNVKNFWKRVEKTNTCWLWRGGISSRGYGNFAFRRNGKIINNRTHRFSFILQNGKIPKNKIICHKCDNPICVNPNHLFLGTISDNVQDAIKKGLWNPARGEQNAASKLTTKIVKKIRNLYSTGRYTQKELAKRFHLSRGGAYPIIRNIHWKHI